MDKKDKKKSSIRNFVAKYSKIFNRSAVFKDKTKYDRKRDKKVDF